ncbi:MAG: hypothetical protein V4651_09430 [Bacteroidota bacterium]
MKKLFLATALFFSLSTVLFAQTQHEAFAKDKELHTGLLAYDLKEFVDEPVLFTCDTVEKKANAAQLAALMRTHLPVLKNTVIKKASETNNGYVQSFGMYQGDDALYYVRFTLNPLSGKLEEVVIEKNN